MSMPPQLGNVASWDDERGYGFIVPLERGNGPDRLFFHVRDYAQAGRRPAVGERVRYVPTRQPDGRWRADAVTRTSLPARARTTRRQQSPGARRWSIGPMPMLLLIASWAVALGWAASSGRLPVETLYALAAINVATFVMYAVDKRAAQSGRWRTPEAQLHLLELSGGWPAAWFAQRWMRHKSAKRGYRVVFWAVTTLHLLAVALWLAA